MPADDHLSDEDGTRRSVLNALGWALTIVLWAAALTFLAVAQMEGW